MANTFKFQFTAADDWPPLAWLARLERGANSIKIYHGKRVETSDEWFGEVVWAGDYTAGDFDETDIVAGSGGRSRDGVVTFVSSGSTVDRLHQIDWDGGNWISNSLCCLLASTEVQLDATYKRYYSDLKSIVLGLDRYKRSVTTSKGTVQLVYFNNLTWDGDALGLSAKPNGDRDFSSFGIYRSFLHSSFAAVAANMSDKARKFPYKFLGTLSSGYDSSTVTVLAREVGCSEVLCVDQSWNGGNDSGEPLARLLGIDPIILSRDGWRSFSRPEPPFIVGDAQGGDVIFREAEQHLNGRVFLAGFHGDKVWDKGESDLGPDLVRADQTGLDLTEYRLHAGFINCPVPFWGARQVNSIQRISTSPEMREWDVPGDYSRPICRRIVEEAGVPRELFGQDKKGAVHVPDASDRFMTEDSTDDLLVWLRDNAAQWTARGMIPPARNLTLDRWKQLARHKLRAATVEQRFLWRVADRIDESRTAIRSAVFPWAIERTCQLYDKPF